MSTLGEALATARRAKGVTQKELSTLVGVSQEIISRYEGESRVPSDDVLARLADVLDVTPDFLKSVDKVRGAWAIDAHLRRRATAQAGVWKTWEARLNMLRNHARFLYEEIDVRSDTIVPTYDPLFAEPADAARMTRMQWRMPVGPVRSLTGWIEAAGCLVVERDFGTERVDGLSQWIDDHPIVLLNSSRPTDRKRLTLAHELGHLCLHTLDIGEDVEKEANLFAAEFLMPADVIRPQLRTLSIGRLVELKRIWGVSMQALIERAYGLNVLSGDRRTSLYKQLSAKGMRKSEPASDEIAPEVPKLAQSIGDALVEGGLSLQDVARMTGYPRLTLDNPFLPQARHLRQVEPPTPIRRKANE